MPLPQSLNVQPNAPNWREAASLLIFAENEKTEARSNFDYSILMVKRSAGSSFMASAFVFPGGAVELSDFDPNWYSLYERHGISEAALNDSISGQIVGSRPPIVSNSITLRKAQPGQRILNPDIALRISAIRETFEEAGILLLTTPDRRNETEYSAVRLSEDELTKWQTLVHNDAKQFYALCDHLRMVPNIWSLYEWSDWLTPVSVGHRRFDTLFYVCHLEKKPSVRVDNAEVTQPIWINPSTILEEHRQEQVFLAPPQVYELSRLIYFTKMDHLRKFSRARQVLGIQRWLPVMLTFDDGSVSVLPGDLRYPQEPKLVSTDPVAEIEGSVDVAESEIGTKNRIELRGIQSRAICNIEPGNGHLPPITYGEEFKEVDLRSKL